MRINCTLLQRLQNRCFQLEGYQAPFFVSPTNKAERIRERALILGEPIFGDFRRQAEKERLRGGRNRLP